jgi:hypothetical protein
MTGLGWLVGGLLFADELFAMAGLLVWGWHAGGPVVGVAAALAGMLVWALFASPKARWRGPVRRPVAKLIVFGLATVGLWAAGHHPTAIVLLAFSIAINAVAVPFERNGWLPA